jgi:aspartate/methionine/tyrosine aminotransferase
MALLSLKKAIIRYTEESLWTPGCAREHVIVTTGAKQSIYNILYTILNPQDEVIILAPHWVSYPEMVKMLYGVPVIVAPEDGTFQPKDAGYRGSDQRLYQGDHRQQRPTTRLAWSTPSRIDRQYL